MFPLGSARAPGADPTRLPIGLDLRAISIVEGIRAGLAAALPIVAAGWFDRPGLALAALGALLTCVCDPAGPIRRRLPILLGFGLVGALLLGGFGLLRGAGIAATTAVALPTLATASFLRVWGQPTQALGNLLAVVMLFGTDRALGWREAGDAAISFAAGSFWALLLTVVIWRIHPFGPARRAVADVWAEQARFVRRLLALAALPDVQLRAWEAQARASRGSVRAAIERAREILTDTIDRSGPGSGPAAQNLLRLEAADQVFAVLIAISDALEQAGPDTRARALPLLRRSRGLFGVLSRATEREALDREPRTVRALAAMEAGVAGDPSLEGLAHALAERLRLAMRYVEPAQFLPGSGPQGDAGLGWRARLTGPLLANLSWQSATFRHAVRSTLVVGVCLIATLIWHGPYAHWLTITLVLVLQPFYALTWQRTLERIGGTLLGGALAAALSTFAQSSLHVAGLLPVLGALALAVRQVSYAVYVAVYTPTVILLVESLRPGTSQLHAAELRAGYTILGGLIAVAANRLLWPAWDPDGVPRDLRAAIAAHAIYAEAVLMETASAPSEKERRAAGLASNNLEASLARAMQEPRRGQRNRFQAVLVADGALRRIGGRLAALQIEPPSTVPRETAHWVVHALEALAGGELPPPAPRPSGTDPLDRLVRQVGLLAATLPRTGLARRATAGADVPPRESGSSGARLG